MTTCKRKVGRPASDPLRNAEIVKLYLGGQTAAEVGCRHNLSPAGVWYILRQFGISREQGGKAEAGRKAAAFRKFAQQYRHPFRALERHDANLSAFESLAQAVEAIQRFTEQKERAQQRQIGWEFSFCEWWQIWADSGLWKLRGRAHAASAVMARHGDIGPYKAGNVYITTLSRNFSESWESSPNRIHGGRLKKFAAARC